jgi:hypothetical protein
LGFSRSRILVNVECSHTPRRVPVYLKNVVPARQEVADHLQAKR